LTKERKQNLIEFQKKMKIKFSDIELLNMALTHKSFVNDNPQKKIKHNERLEFLGDSILGYIISEYLFEKFHNYNEGMLSKMKSYIVSKKNISQISKQLNFGKYIMLGNGEIISGGRSRISLLEDVMEAFIAAYYLDKGITLTKKLVIKLFKQKTENAISQKSREEYKTILQEIFQKKYKKVPKYNILKEEGPEHKKIFFCEIRSNKIGVIGKGKSKKDAENNAAKKMLIKLKVK